MHVLVSKSWLCGWGFRPKTQMELVMEAEQAAKRARDERAAAAEKSSKPATNGRKDEAWLRENIIVKVL